jgi:hypothetical protein
MDRGKYRKLRASLEKELQKQSTEGFISVSPSFLAAITGTPWREVDAAWPALVKDCKLVLDGTGLQSWTRPGQGATAEQIAALKKALI